MEGTCCTNSFVVSSFLVYLNHLNFDLLKVQICCLSRMVAPPALPSNLFSVFEIVRNFRFTLFATIRLQGSVRHCLSKLRTLILFV